MSEALNRQAALNYVEAFNLMDLTALRDLFTEDAQVHGMLGCGSEPGQDHVPSSGGG